ncbi:hypothetical protein K474DRAFT_1659175 [Panus rudis PR-1116 ss-1]|nr:hypothetical protein K474DRAFT_1659175 [Panus rudis PR-1116 ss-1]
MHIRIAPSENPSLLDSRCSHVSRLLEQIPSTSLRTLNVRGFLTPALNLAIARHTFLRELTFLSGFYISPELLGAITAMPYLKKLRCHATVMESAQLEPFLPRTQPTFPSLTSIHFVGKPSVIHTLVDLLPAGQLESVTLEAYRPPRADASFWRSIIETLSAKASDTLTQLDIYHTIEQDDIDVGPLLALDSSFTLDILRPLSRCIHLHQFTLGSNTPYAITNKDLDSLVAGWPDISILRLDTSLFANHIRPSKMTVASLDMLARRCPKLRVLSIPLDISAHAPATADDKSDPRAPTVQRTLNSLYVKYSQEARHVSPFIDMAIRIFPGMEELELESFDDQVVWDCTSGKASFTYAGAADGLADGQ